MNFKPTLLKNIVSIIVGVLAGLQLFVMNLSGIGATGDYNYPLEFGIYGFITGLFITYLIWSLLQRK